MYIPKEILDLLEKNSKLKNKCNANQISYMFEIPKSTAYRYIRIFKNMGDVNKEYLTLKTKKNKVISNHQFDMFLFEILNSVGFESTNQLYQACLKKFPVGNISRHTFNKFFAEARERQKAKLKKMPLRITKSKNIPMIGFYTVKRKLKVLDKVLDYEE